MCQLQVEETIEHLFLHRPFGAGCWAKLNISWGAQNNRLDLVAAGKQNYHTQLLSLDD